MPPRGLHRIFSPRSVVVVGASPRLGSVGQTVLQNLTIGEFQGVVSAVNPKYAEVSGVRCFRSVAELPQPADLAVVCTPAATVPDIVRQCGEAGILGIVILSAGFREVGSAGQALETEIAHWCKSFPGMRIIGPNCLGVMALHRGLNASFASDTAPRGSVAFLSQSGALCTSILDWALQEHVGFSYFVSVGNMLDVGIADLIDFFAMDRHTDSIVMYVESISQARRFMSAARAFTKTKPIIAYKAGRFSESAQAAASHTGAMAGVDSAYEAAFARAGIVRVFEADDLFNCAELLARHKAPQGPRLAIVTNAGGPGVMATDCLLSRGGSLAKLTSATLEQLDAQLPPAWSRGNPVDVLGDATPERFEAAARVVLADPQVDGVLAILTPQAMTDPTAAASGLIAAASGASKPLLAAWMGGAKMRAGIELLNHAHIATYESPEKAVRAFMHLVTYARNREMLYETPRAVPLEFALDRAKLREVFASSLRDGRDVLSEASSKALLEAYDIPVSKTHIAASSEEAVACARQVGYPVVLKVYSHDITHKTDVQGVELNLAGDQEVHQAFDRIVTRAGQLRPDAHIEGVTVQPMILATDARELIVGAKRDPVFGAVLLVGAGGTNAELLQDHALELPPLNEPLARRMLESLRIWPLLQGYRGRPRANIDRLIEVLMRVSYLVADCPEIRELDINPLLVTPEGALALDARVILERDALLNPPMPYSHLAIRPYPEEYVKPAQLKSGQAILLRPIRPEDEPMWHELVTSCSKETIRRRFRYLFKDSTHEMATRFCFNDYDRELTIVAELNTGVVPKLIGVGQLMADAEHVQAEFAVLVADAWQSQGLGSLLTDYCLTICQSWGISQVTAEVASDNNRMLRMFQNRGFQRIPTHDSDTVFVKLTF